MVFGDGGGGGGGWHPSIHRPHPKKTINRERLSEPLRRRELNTTYARHLSQRSFLPPNKSIVVPTKCSGSEGPNPIRSRAGCAHSQGGKGGAGGREQNVAAASVLPPSSVRLYRPYGGMDVDTLHMPAPPWTSSRRHDGFFLPDKGTIVRVNVPMVPYDRSAPIQ